MWITEGVFIKTYKKAVFNVYVKIQHAVENWTATQVTSSLRCRAYVTMVPKVGLEPTLP